MNCQNGACTLASIDPKQKVGTARTMRAGTIHMPLSKGGISGETNQNQSVKIYTALDGRGLPEIVLCTVGRKALK